MADTSTNSWKLLYETGRQALQSRKLQEAEQSFSAALQLAEDFPPGDPRLAATLNALARIYSLQRRYLAAAALLNRLLEVTERTLGPTHVQVAGVLTNLAEMYTHLGAAREELELRERVLAIRRDDPNADATLLRRLTERVAELRATLESQDAIDDTDEIIEPLPVVRTAEYSSPVPTADDRIIWSTGTTPSDIELVPTAAAGVEPAPTQWSRATVSRVTPPVHSVLGVMNDEHAFADMEREEVRKSVMSRRAAKSSLYSIAAGVVLVVGLLAARNSVATPDDDERESAGSVSLANVPATQTMPAAVVVPPPADPRTVEQLVAERRAEYKRSMTQPEPARESSRGETRERSAELPRSLPSAAAIERALRGVDGAVKLIDQRTRAATDSASGLRLETPTFKATRMSDAVLRPPDRP